MAEVLLKEYQEQDHAGNMEDVQEVLTIEPSHHDGVYRILVHRDTLKGMFRTTTIFANGNFNIKVAEGRKSAKKLEKLSNYIEDNKEVLKDMWLANKYQCMADTITTDMLIKKIL